MSEPVLDHVRDIIGLPMRGLQNGYHVGWTTDETKQALVVWAGGTSREVTAHSGRVIGWEVSFEVGAEMPEAAAA